jgi:hypothetical protein
MYIDSQTSNHNTRYQVVREGGVLALNSHVCVRSDIHRNK